jgi:hypothetical protein
MRVLNITLRSKQLRPVDTDDRLEYEQNSKVVNNPVQHQRSSCDVEMKEAADWLTITSQLSQASHQETCLNRVCEDVAVLLAE